MSVYISTYIWRRISRELRRAILRILFRRDVVGRYVSAVVNDLDIRGQGDLADALLEEVEYLRDYKRQWGVLPPPAKR